MLQADVVLDCGATETACGLVDAVTQGFPHSRVEVDSLERPRFRLLMVTGAGLCQESGCWLHGMDQHSHSGRRKRARFCRYDLLENHERFERTEFERQHSCLVCLAIPLRGFVSTRIRHLSTDTERGLFLSRHRQILLFHQETCASHLSSRQSCVRLEHG